MIEFVAYITPLAKGRPRVTKTGDAHTPAKTRRWESDFRAIAERHLPERPLEGPLEVTVLAVLPRPKRLMRQRDPDGLIWAPKRPDIDNLLKAVLDSIVFWNDDAQVVSLIASKVYAEKDGRPRVAVRITEADTWTCGAACVFGMEHVA